VLLFVVGALLLSYPVLAIFNRPAMLAGIPVLYLYLFGVWLAGIVAVFALARRPWDDAP
jgi:type IV secretory pathway VirB3-like protein